MGSKRIIVMASVATVLLMVLAGFAAVPGAATTKTEDRYVVLFDGDIDTALIKNKGGDVIKSNAGMGMVVAKMNSDEAKALKKSQKVYTVEKDQKVYAATPPFPPPGKNKDDPDPEPEPEVELQWGVDRIDAEATWATTEGDGIIVAIIDTGVDLDHPELSGRVLTGTSFVDGVNSPDDDNGHGTHCAGIVAAEWDFGFDDEDQSGVVGVAPLVSILPVKVLDYSGSGWLSDTAEGIDWAVSHGADVISMSLGGSSDVLVLETACANAYDAGVLLVASAGNSGKKRDTLDNIGYPARYSTVIAVGATDSSDARARFSSTGPALELMAPGVAIESTYMGGGYATMSGTSMACPHVAGVIALVLTTSVKEGYDYEGGTTNEWDPVEVRDLLADTATDLGKDNAYGNGLVDAEYAVVGTTAGDN